MNVIEAVKRTIAEYSEIDSFSGGIHVDYTAETTGGMGLFPTGDTLVREDILGGQVRRCTFQLMAAANSFNDFDRLANSSWLLDFGYYLDAQRRIEITAGARSGEITKITPSGAMLYGYVSTDPSDGVVYQLQIAAEYTIH